MSKRLADLRPSQLEEDDSRILSLVTGLTPRGVSRRLNGAHGNSLMSSIFGAEWPVDADTLGPLTVATAMKANLVDEISDATGLTRATVRARLARVEGKKMLLANLFPELSVDGEDDEEEDEEEEVDDDAEEEHDGTDGELERAGGQQRFLDPEAGFSVTELVGAIRVAALRGARPLLRWLARRMNISTQSLSGKVRSADGRKLLSTLLAERWPVRVAGPSRAMLGELTAVTVHRAPPLLRWAADVAGLDPGELARRLRSADTTAKLSGLVPELSEDGGAEADEEQDEEENDEGGTESDQPFASARRFLDESSSFTVTELVGDIRAVSLRRAPALVEWLAARTELSERVLRSRFKKAHGRTLLRTILTDVWPLRVTGPSRVMLADLTTGAVCLSPSLLRWVADVAGVGVGDARQRVEAAHGNTRLARALPELVSGNEAEEGGEEEDDEEAEEPNRPPSRAPRAKHISVAPPSTRKRIVSGRYELHGRIGSGHFGTVWEAMRIEHPQNRVVLKVARRAEAGRLREEMLIANRLRHPNICTYLDYGSDPSFGEYLVMDHCGKSLQDILSAGNPLEVEQAIEVVRQAADGLEFAHSRGVLHHDIKPGNILIEARKSDAWDVRVGDFGVSVKGRTGQNTLGAHTVFGTEPVGWTDAYASPELLRGEKAGKRSDQYALGLVFCSMLEGDVFERRYKARTFGRLSSRQNAAVARALSSDAQDRFDSCTAFAAALARR